MIFTCELERGSFFINYLSSYWVHVQSNSTYQKYFQFQCSLENENLFKIRYCTIPFPIDFFKCLYVIPRWDSGIYGIFLGSTTWTTFCQVATHNVFLCFWSLHGLKWCPTSSENMTFILYLKTNSELKAFSFFCYNNNVNSFPQSSASSRQSWYHSPAVVSNKE